MATIVRTEDAQMRIPLLGAATLIVLAIIATAIASVGGVGATRNAPVVAAAFKDIRVEDQTDGTLVVTEIASPSSVHVIRPRDGRGFVGIAVRGMNYDRAAAAIDPASPFRLLRDINGRLWLEDLVTHKRIALDAFGPVNAHAFAQLLTDGKATP